MDEQIAEKIREFFDTMETIDVYFWETDDVDIINREDLKSIIEEGMLDREVMDTYVGLIAEDFEKNGITDQTFMNMVASYCVIMNMEGGIEMNLNEPLWTSINKSRIFFPIHHGNSNHYSLLIMDNKIRKFIHMNPLRPKKMSRTKSTTRMPKKSISTGGSNL